MAMSPELGVQNLTPEQEFTEAKYIADQVFAEAALVIVRAITRPDSIDTIAAIPLSDIAVPEKDSKSGIGLITTALCNYADTSFDSYVDADSRTWLDSRPEFKKVVDLLAQCPHRTEVGKNLCKKYERPTDNLRSNITFLIQHVPFASQLIGKNTIEIKALHDSESTFRQIGKLYDYQQKRFDVTTDLRWSEPDQRLRVRHPKGMSGARRDIERDIDSNSKKDPRPPYMYKRGCAALHTPEGETDDAFTVLWNWCADVIADPRIQHLLDDKNIVSISRNKVRIPKY